MEQAVDTIFDQIASALARGDRVELRGFGSFTVRMREGRVGRNPRTGSKIHVSDLPVFRQSNEIHKRLNFVAPMAETQRTFPLVGTVLVFMAGSAVGGVINPLDDKLIVSLVHFRSTHTETNNSRIHKSRCAQI